MLQKCSLKQHGNIPFKVPEVCGHETVDEEVGARVQGEQEVRDRRRHQRPQLDGVAVHGQAAPVLLQDSLEKQIQ